MPTMYQLKFMQRDNPECGVAFVCDANGIVDIDKLKLKPAKFATYQQVIAENGLYHFSPIIEQSEVSQATIEALS